MGQEGMYKFKYLVSWHWTVEASNVLLIHGKATALPFRKTARPESKQAIQ